MKELNVSEFNEMTSISNNRDCCANCLGKWCVNMSSMTEEELLGKCAYVTTQKLLSLKIFSLYHLMSTQRVEAPHYNQYELLNHPAPFSLTVLRESHE